MKIFTLSCTTCWDNIEWINIFLKNLIRLGKIITSVYNLMRIYSFNYHSFHPYPLQQVHFYSKFVLDFKFCLAFRENLYHSIPPLLYARSSNNRITYIKKKIIKKEAHSATFSPFLHFCTVKHRLTNFTI